MKENYPKGIGPTGRWLIFSGANWAVVALFICASRSLEPVVGERSWPYVIYGTPGIIVIASAVLYDHIPSRLIVPVGLIGWAFAVSLLLWYFWFGPGAVTV